MKLNPSKARAPARKNIFGSTFSKPGEAEGQGRSEYWRPKAIEGSEKQSEKGRPEGEEDERSGRGQLKEEKREREGKPSFLLLIYKGEGTSTPRVGGDWEESKRKGKKRSKALFYVNSLGKKRPCKVMFRNRPRSRNLGDMEG